MEKMVSRVTVELLCLVDIQLRAEWNLSKTFFRWHTNCARRKSVLTIFDSTVSSTNRTLTFPRTVVLLIFFARNQWVCLSDNCYERHKKHILTFTPWLVHHVEAQFHWPSNEKHVECPQTIACPWVNPHNLRNEPVYARNKRHTLYTSVKWLFWHVNTGIQHVCDATRVCLGHTRLPIQEFYQIVIWHFEIVD